MIKNFERYTSKLNKVEKVALRAVAYELKGREGKCMSITNKQLRSRLWDFGIELSDSRIRKIINFLRINKIIEKLVASSSGYYIAETDQELREYLESLQGRIDALKELKMSYKNQWNGQQKLF